MALAGQLYTGFKEHNKERKEEGREPMSMNSYLSSGHFIQATFENWESEFLQMALFVVLTVSLRQKGSSESKRFEEEEVDREPSAKRKDAPWPVYKGGILLNFYKHSLSIVLILLFIVSFLLHFYGSFKRRERAPGHERPAGRRDKQLYNKCPVLVRIFSKLAK